LEQRRPIKILIVHHCLSLGGGTKSAYDLVNSISTIHNVTLATPGEIDSEGYIKRLFDKAISPKPVTLSHYSAGPNLIKSAILYVCSRVYKHKWLDFFKNQSADIIILNSIVMSPLIPIIKKLGFKVVLFIRETMKGSKRNLFNRYLKHLLEKADLVTFLTKYDQDQWNLRNDTMVFPDIADLGSPQNQADSKLSHKVLYFGGLSKSKGIHLLIKAFQNIETNSVELLVLGNMDKPRGNILIRFLKHPIDIIHLDRIYKQAMSMRNVKIIGLQRDIKKWLLMSDIVIFPVSAVHQARPVYEAGWAYKTVIVPDFMNFKDIVIDRLNGRTFKQNDWRDLARTIDDLYRSTDLIRELGRVNHKFYEEEHSPLVGKQKMSELLEYIFSS